jgi:uncharacterized RDD family membrane protein YckC
MPYSVRFETPENISISYQVAGLGTRFVAWILDSIIIVIIIIVVFFVLAALSFVIGNVFGYVSGVFRSMIVGVALLVLLIGSIFFVYYALFEWTMNGQTPGKRLANIRTVMAGGFSITFTAIAIRNIFRVIDTFPLFWFVPLISKNSQRFGDMVAGTLVVTEGRTYRDEMQQMLLKRSPGLAQFTFTVHQLESLKEEHYTAVLSYLDRSTSLPSDRSRKIARTLTAKITAHLELPPIYSLEEQERFLLDLATAKLRHDLRELG